MGLFLWNGWSITSLLDGSYTPITHYGEASTCFFLLLDAPRSRKCLPLQFYLLIYFLLFFKFMKILWNMLRRVVDLSTIYCEMKVKSIYLLQFILIKSSFFYMSDHSRKKWTKRFKSQYLINASRQDTSDLVLSHRLMCKLV